MSYDDNVKAKIIIVSTREIFYQGLLHILGNDKYKIEWIKDSISLVNEFNSSDSNTLFIVENLYVKMDHNNMLYFLRDRLSERNFLCVVPELDKKVEFEYLRIGVKGILSVSDNTEKIKKAIKCLLNGEMWMRREILEEFIRSVIRVKSYSERIDDSNLTQLKQREIEILTLVAKNYSNKQIADNLFLTEKTVKNYLTKIYKKLKISSRSEVHTKIKPLINRH